MIAKTIISLIIFLFLLLIRLFLLVLAYLFVIGALLLARHWLHVASRLLWQMDQRVWLLCLVGVVNFVESVYGHGALPMRNIVAWAHFVWGQVVTFHVGYIMRRHYRKLALIIIEIARVRLTTVAYRVLRILNFDFLSFELGIVLLL